MPDSLAPPKPQTFRSTEAADLAGISFRQLDYWARLGIVVPSITDGAGSGNRRRYSAQDVRILRAVGALSALGAQASQLGPVVARLGLIACWEGLLFVAPDGSCSFHSHPLAAHPVVWAVRLDACEIPEPPPEGLEMAAPEAEPTRRCGWKGCPLPVVPAAFVEGTIFLSGRMVEVRVEVCSEHFEAVTGEHLTELDVAR